MKFVIMATRNNRVGFQFSEAAEFDVFRVSLLQPGESVGEGPVSRNKCYLASNPSAPLFPFFGKNSESASRKQS
jgi:hypothetical protein